MKKRLFNWGVTTNTIISNVTVVALVTVFLIFVFGNINTHIEETNQQNIETDQVNNKVLNFYQVNNDLALLVKDVSFTGTLVQNYIISGEEKYETERIRIWEKRMIPLINKLENEFEFGYIDEIKAKFNTVIDHAIESKNKQEEVIENFDETNIAIKIKELNEEFRKVSDSYEAFVSIKQQDQVTVYKIVNVEYDNNYYFFFAILLILIVVIVYNLIRSLTKPIQLIEKNLSLINEGEIPNQMETNHFDYALTIRSINYMSKMLSGIKDFALKVGQGHFEKDENLLFAGQGVLGESLSYMQESLMKVAEDDRQRNHINEGLAKFSEILGKNTNSLERFGDETVLNLVKFLNANQGAIFVVNDEDHDKHHLELIASYAYNKKKYVDVKIVKGQGLVGQAWQEGKRIYMTEVPKNYVTITSGLGYSTPRCILILPLIFNEEIHGVIELASFHILADYELGFIEKVSESISSALASVKVNTRTQRLLSQSEEITNNMKLQDEKKEKTLSELTQMQEDSQRREEENLREIKRLKKRLDEYEKNF